MAHGRVSRRLAHGLTALSGRRCGAVCRPCRGSRDQGRDDRAGRFLVDARDAWRSRADQGAYGGARRDQVLPRRRHGQRRSGAAQDQNRAAAGRRVHGRGARASVTPHSTSTGFLCCSVRSMRSMRPRAVRPQAHRRPRASRFRELRLQSRAGSRNSMANEPDARVEDLRRKKVWVPEGDEISFLAMQTLGLSPVVLPLTDVLTGLQTGLLDVVAGFARRRAGAAMAYQGQISHRAARDLFDGHIRARCGARSTALSGRGSGRRSRGHGRVMRRSNASSRDDNRAAAERHDERRRGAGTVNPADVEGWRRGVESIYPQLRGRARHGCGAVRRDARAAGDATVSGHGAPTQ